MEPCPVFTTKKKTQYARRRKLSFEKKTVFNSLFVCFCIAWMTLVVCVFEQLSPIVYFFFLAVVFVSVRVVEKKRPS